MGFVLDGFTATNSTAGTLIDTIARRLYRGVERMPWIPPIWIREVWTEGGVLRERLLAHFPREAFTMLEEALSREQRAKRIAVGVEPRLIFMTVAAVALLPLATRGLWSRISEMADLTNDQLLGHALTVLATGLAPPQRNAPRNRRTLRSRNKERKPKSAIVVGFAPPRRLDHTAHRGCTSYSRMTRRLTKSFRPRAVRAGLRHDPD
jgi:hypothetical protein